MTMITRQDIERESRVILPGPEIPLTASQLRMLADARNVNALAVDECNFAEEDARIERATHLRQRRALYLVVAAIAAAAFAYLVFR